MVHLRDGLVRIYWGPFRFLVQRLPVPASYALGKALGRLLGFVPNARLMGMARAARLVLGPDAPEGECLSLARRALVNFCLNDLEVLLFPKLNPEIMAGIMRIEGREHLDAALGAGKGAMLVFGHFGANQMVMPAIGYAGYAMYQLSAPASVLNEKLPEARSPHVLRTREMRWEHEQTLPVTHINIFGSMKPAFTCLKNNHVLGIAMDGGGGEKRAMVSFLGRRALFSVGAAAMAMRTGCAVIPAFMIREDDGFNRLVLEKPLAMEQAASKEERDAVLALNLQAMVSRLEEHVRERPDLYLYFLSFRELMARGGHDPFFLEDEGERFEAKRASST